RLLLLEHHPDCFDVITRKSPITLCIEIAEKQFVLLSELDSSQRLRDLARDKSFSAPGRLVIEQDPIACEETIPFSVIRRHPVRVDFRRRIRASWLEGRVFALGRRRTSKHFTARRVIKARANASFPDRFEQTHSTQRNDFACVLRNVETHPNVALSAKV